MYSLIQTFLVAMAALTAGDMVEGWYSPKGFTEYFVKMSLKDHLENVKRWTYAMTTFSFVPFQGAVRRLSVLLFVYGHIIQSNKAVDFLLIRTLCAIMLLKYRDFKSSLKFGSWRGVFRVLSYTQFTRLLCHCCFVVVLGTHWVWEIVHVLLTGGIHKNQKETAMLDMIPVDKLDTIPSPRILNTHFPPHLLPVAISERKAKIIYVYRSTKDVVISSYYF